jgi:hypothetical protein
VTTGQQYKSNDLLGVAFGQISPAEFDRRLNDGTARQMIRTRGTTRNK